MKKSGLLAASVAAASAYSFSSSSPSSACVSCNLPRVSNSQEESGSDKDKTRKSAASGDKFAPKFDGLRFIETLVTAHR